MKFEYRIENIDGMDLGRRLNELGEMGWELVRITDNTSMTFSASHPQITHYCIFKRRVVDQLAVLHG